MTVEPRPQRELEVLRDTDPVAWLRDKAERRVPADLRGTLNAAAALHVCDLAAEVTRLTEALRDARTDAEIALGGIPDPMHPSLREWSDKLAAAQVIIAHLSGHDDPGNVYSARAALSAGEPPPCEHEWVHGINVAGARVTWCAKCEVLAAAGVGEQPQ